MYINDVDISTYGARVLGFKLSTSNITNNYYVPPNNNTPILISSTHNGKPLSVRIGINGNSFDNNYLVYSRLKKDLNKCILKPKSSSFYFDCILTGDDVNVKFGKVIKEVEFTFICFQYTVQQTQAITVKNTVYSVNNVGTYKTPAVVNFKPNGSGFTDEVISFDFYPNYVNENVYDYDSYFITLASGDISKQIVLDGEKSTFTIDGKNAISRLSMIRYSSRISGYQTMGSVTSPIIGIVETPLLQFPTFESGSNKFRIYTSASDSFTCSVTWKPRWL